MLSELFGEVLALSLAASAVLLPLLLLAKRLGRRFPARWSCLVWLAGCIRLLLPLRIKLRHVPVLSLPAPQSTAPAAVNGTAAAAAAVPQNPIGLWQVLAFLWAAGAVLFLLSRFLGYAVLRRRLRRWRYAPVPQAVLAQVQHTAQELGLRRVPRVVCTDAVPGPMVTGFFAPVLVLPSAGFSPGELCLVLRHELTHCRRGDIWYQLALVLAACVHWFNPVVHLMGRRALQDLERACDAQALESLDKGSRCLYAHLLLRQADNRASAQCTAFTTCFKGGKRNMKERLTDILCGTSRRRGLLALTALVVLFAVCTSFVACAARGLTADGIAALDRAFAEGVHLDTGGNTISFTVPKDTPDGCHWQVLAAGRMDLGGGNGMSLHLFEGENLPGSWVPGETYSAEVDWSMVSEFQLLATLVNSETGETVLTCEHGYTSDS